MSTHMGNQKSAKRLSECIDYYEVCNRAEGKSPKTISWYSANLRRFRNYLKSRHLPDSLDNIDTKLIREYVIYLLKKNRFDGHPYTPVQIERLKRLKEERDNQTVSEVLDRVRNVARGDENVMPVLIEAVKAYATVGEISDALREVFGEYREPSIL